MTRQTLFEAASALAQRASWYEARGYNVPGRIMRALREVCDALGIDPVTLEPVKS